MINKGIFPEKQKKENIKNISDFFLILATLPLNGVEWKFGSRYNPQSLRFIGG
jgi:hypothetical protein